MYEGHGFSPGHKKKHSGSDDHLKWSSFVSGSFVPVGVTEGMLTRSFGKENIDH